MMILDHHMTSRERRKPIPETETPLFWVKLAAMSAVKNRKSDGRLMPAYDPKKLLPEYFATEEEREQMDRKRQAKEEYENVEWKSPSEAKDDWEKTQALLAKFANMPLSEQEPVEVPENENVALPGDLGPPESVERYASPEQPLTDDDLNWI